MYICEKKHSKERITYMYISFQETLESVSKIQNRPCLLSNLLNACVKLWRENKEYYAILRKKCELHRNEKLKPLSCSTRKASGTFLSKQSMDDNNDQTKLNRNSNGSKLNQLSAIRLFLATHVSATSSLWVCYPVFLVHTNRYIAEQSIKDINAHK